MFKDVQCDHRKSYATHQADSQIPAKMRSSIVLSMVASCNNFRYSALRSATSFGRGRRIDQCFHEAHKKKSQGVIYGKHHSVHHLYKRTYGQNIFPDTMARKYFLKIKKFIRFYNKDRRRQRLTRNKCVLICEQLESFVTNCLLIYAPDWSLSINKQLFPIKNRCPFIVCMPNKPEKFGTKFWMLTKVYSKYGYKILPYLRALKRE